jgi:hypothetical protein
MAEFVRVGRTEEGRERGFFFLVRMNQTENASRDINIIWLRYQIFSML